MSSRGAGSDPASAYVETRALVFRRDPDRRAAMISSDLAAGNEVARACDHLDTDHDHRRTTRPDGGLRPQKNIVITWRRETETMPDR